MKTLTFNKDSWHFKMATAVGYSPDWDDTGAQRAGDICGYSKAVLLCALFYLVIATSTIVLTMMAVEAVMGLVFSLAYGTWIMSELGEIFLLIIGIFAAALSVCYGAYSFHKWSENLNNRHSDQPDSFVKHAYLSWKDKFCARIVFKE